ncbi:MAG TPA: tripartite tricarboxylate transporter substrate binding protein [Burkholderiales bacterium]|nr:tripartite tricarboxylate transporter substrate binding protein [Burkholderiales bacterium]
MSVRTANYALRLMGLAVAAAALSRCVYGQPAEATAQRYPARPIRIVSPFAAGGSTDILARLIGQKLTESWGEPVIVDNRAGAGGIIGSDLVAKAQPDGYTLLLTSTSAHAINPALHRTLPYDPLRDFAAVTQVATGHNILVVHPSVPAKSVQELIALAKSKPGTLTFSSGGNGTPAHIAGELFKSLAKVDMVHVPYKGGGPAAVALLAGEVSLSFGSVTTVLPQVRANRLKSLAVTGAKRSSMVPELPTIAEAGVPGYALNSWYGVLAPARTPRQIVAKLSTEIVRILNLADVRAKLLQEGVDPEGTTPQEFSAFIRAEVEKWPRLVKAAGARID